MKKNRKIIVNLATSADGFIARKDGDIEWLNRLPPPKGFYGLVKFARSVDTKLLGRKTYDLSLELGEKFDSKTKCYVFTRHPSSVQKRGAVEFVTEPIDSFASKLRESKGKDIWLMGGAEIIAAFLDAGAIDEFIISIVPIFIGEGIPLMTNSFRDIPLELHATEQFPDGVVQLHYKVVKN